MKSHPKLSLTLAIVFGTIAVLALIPSLNYISGDIGSGALSGTPETGWGFMIALVFFGPIILVSSLISFFSYRSYKRATSQPAATAPAGPQQPYQAPAQVAEQPQQQAAEQPQPAPEQPQSVPETQQPTAGQQPQ